MNNFMISEQRNATNPSASSNAAAYGSQQNMTSGQQQPSYYDIGGMGAMGGASGKLAHHHQSAQNLEHIPRNGSQKLSGK